MNDWDNLREHLVNRALIFGDTVKGKKYSMFLDTREALLCSGYLKIAGQLIWRRIKSYQPEVIVGQGLGAANLLLSVQIAAEENCYQLATLIGRDSRKLRNRHKLFEGPATREGARAVYIDDAFNYGNTFFKCTNLLRQEGINLDIKLICVLYDFWNQYGSRRLEITGMPIERIYTRHDLGLTRIDPKHSPIEEKIQWRNLAYNQWTAYLKAPPTLHDDTVLFATDRHEVWCHDLDSGDIRWQWQGPRPKQEKGIASRPQVIDDKVIFSSYDGSVYCLDYHSGNCIWNRNLDMFLHSTPFVTNGKIYIGTEGGLQYKRGDIVCQDLVTGQVSWRFPTGDVIPASPIVFSDQVICGSNDGYLYSITNGLLNWSLYLGVIKGRPNFIDNILIVSTEDGNLFGLDQHGKPLWQRTTGTRTIHQFLPRHKDGLVYVINQDHIILAYDKMGNQKWVRKLRGQGYYNCELFNDELGIVCHNGYAVILNALTGKKIRQSWFKYRVTCPPAFNKDYFCVHSQEQGLIVYKRA